MVAKRVLRWLGRQIYRHPYIVVAVFLIATSFVYTHAIKLKLETDMTKFIPEDLEVLQTMQFISNEYGNQDTVILLLELDDTVDEPDAVRDMRDPRVLAFTRALGERLEDVKELSSSDSVAKTITQRHRPFPTTMEGSVALHEQMGSLGRFYNKAYTRSVVFGFGSVSVDARRLDLFENNVRDAIRFARPPMGVRVEVTGRPSMMRVMMIVLVGGARDSIGYSLALVFITLYLYFRSGMVAAIPMLPIILSVIWTAGFMEMLDIPLSTITVGIGAMLIGIGIDYGIHVVHRYLEEREEGKSVEEAVEETLSDLGMAVLATATTTMAGFLAMRMGRMPGIQDLGTVLALGIFFSMLSSLVLLVALLVITEKGRKGPVEVVRVQSLDRFFVFVGTLVESWPVSTMLVLIVFTAFMANGAQYVKTLTDMSADSPKSLSVVRSMDSFENEFGGAESAFIVFQLNDVAPAPDSLVDRAFLEELHILSQFIAREEHVDSVGDPWEGFQEQSIPGRERVPYDERELLAAVEDRGKLGRYYNKKRDILLMSVGTSIGNEQTLNEKFMTAIERDVAQMDIPSHVTVAYSGGPAFGRIIGALIGGDMARTTMWGLIFVMVIVFLIYRSPALALVCLMPLMISMVWVRGVMGYAGIHMTMATSSVFSMIMGLGIDFSLHLAHRYHGLRKTLPSSEAMAQTYRSVGSAITVTTITTIMGFMAMTIGDNPGMDRMGLTLSIGVTSALIGALMIVPPITVLEERFAAWLKCQAAESNGLCSRVLCRVLGTALGSV